VFLIYSSGNVFQNEISLCTKIKCPENEQTKQDSHYKKDSGQLMKDAQSKQ